MSWKATAYVKELLRITPAEKLLLFVLADYHNTQMKASWPNIGTLARESLMSERNASRLLDGLEKKGILERDIGRGRGNYTCYRFVELDGRKDDNLSSFPTPKRGQVEPEKMTNGPVKDDKNPTAIRKERVEREGTGYSPRKRGLPEDFQPNDHHKTLASQNGLILDRVLEEFRDYHLAHASRFADWDRALNTWLHNAKRFDRGRRISDQDIFDREIAMAREWESRGGGGKPQ